MRILNLTQKTVISAKARFARSFFTRLIGLMNKRAFPWGEGLIITHCQAIHMLFMRFAIDAIFVDKNNTVVGRVEAIKPFRLSPFFPKANFCIECPIGTIRSSRTTLGDQIKTEEPG